MAHDYIIKKLPIQTSLFDKTDDVYQILCSGIALFDLCHVLRDVIGNCKKRPLTSYEQDVLCELYNSISIFKLNHKL